MLILQESFTAVVELAERAPSIHDTRPWIWRPFEGGLDLYVADDRRLPVADPTGRQQLVSCGASLHHLQVGARALGFRSEVTTLPDSDRPEHLARVVLSPADPPASATDDLCVLRTRHTCRPRFSSWLIPDGRLIWLAALGREQGAQVVPVIDEAARLHIGRLMRRAAAIEHEDPRYADGMRRWLGRARQDTGEYSNEGYAGLLVIGSTLDARLPWLRSGQALSAIWLSAVGTGLSVNPSSQLVEVEETRLALSADVTVDVAAPHVLVRLGWPLW